MSARVAGPATRRQRGLALIVVLWMSALLVLLAGAYSFSLRTEARLSGGVVDRARAGAAADAAVRRMLVALVEQAREAPARAEARMDFDGVQVAVVAVTENSKVDLNTAPAKLIESLVASVAARVDGFDPARARAVSDAILDWRDRDDKERTQGAELRSYQDAGLATVPRDGTFLSVSELAQVMGVTPALYDALAPLVTVHSWSPQVDPMTASPEVLRGVPGIDPQQVDAFVESRAAESGASAARRFGSEAARYLATTRLAVYSVTAHAVAPSGVVATRRAVVKVNARSRRPLSVMAWHHEAPGPPAPAATGPGALDGGAG